MNPFFTPATYKYEGDPTFFLAGLIFVAAITACVFFISKDRRSPSHTEDNGEDNEQDKSEREAQIWTGH